jgi:hypothetical protein
VGAGLPNILVLHPQVPADIIKYVKGLGNWLVTYGAGTSFLELYNEVEEIGKNWNQVKEAYGASTTGAGSADKGSDKERQFSGYQNKFAKYLEDNGVHDCSQLSRLRILWSTRRKGMHQ